MTFNSNMPIGDILSVFDKDVNVAQHKLEMVLYSLSRLNIIENYNENQLDKEVDEKGSY